MKLARLMLNEIQYFGFLKYTNQLDKVFQLQCGYIFCLHRIFFFQPPYNIRGYTSFTSRYIVGTGTITLHSQNNMRYLVSK